MDERGQPVALLSIPNDYPPMLLLPSLSSALPPQVHKDRLLRNNLRIHRTMQVHRVDLRRYIHHGKLSQNRIPMMMDLSASREDRAPAKEAT